MKKLLLLILVPILATQFVLLEDYEQDIVNLETRLYELEESLVFEYEQDHTVYYYNASGELEDGNVVSITTGYTPHYNGQELDGYTLVSYVMCVGDDCSNLTEDATYSPTGEVFTKEELEQGTEDGLQQLISMYDDFF